MKSFRTVGNGVCGVTRRMSVEKPVYYQNVKAHMPIGVRIPDAPLKGFNSLNPFFSFIPFEREQLKTFIAALL